MKYKVGDRVRIKSLNWYNENKDEYGNFDINDDFTFYANRSKYCGKVFTITGVFDKCYTVKEDNNEYYWIDEMIEGLVEEENINNKWNGLKVELELSKSIIGVSNVESLCGERYMSGFVKAIIPPNGYEFRDENGNVINAQKIVLEKKKKEYPKTYEECCKVLGINPDNYLSIRNPFYDDGDEDTTNYEQDLLGIFDSLWELKICRDAYWKIAGEEMGLGKPWSPSDSDYVTGRYCIFVYRGNIICSTPAQDCILTFPTEEIRDAFYENFKSEIEICKEFL